MSVRVLDCDPVSCAVDPEEDDCPDYRKIIKVPMDLGTVKKVLNARKSYTGFESFAHDVRLVFKNAIKYNPTGHNVRLDAELLLDLFESRWALTASGISEGEQHGGGKAERARKTVENFDPCNKPVVRERRKKKEEDKSLSRDNRSARRQEVNSSREEDGEESDAGPRRRSGRACQPEEQERRGARGNGGGSSAKRKVSRSQEEGRRGSESKHAGSAPKTRACETGIGPRDPPALSQT